MSSWPNKMVLLCQIHHWRHYVLQFIGGWRVKKRDFHAYKNKRAINMRSNWKHSLESCDCTIQWARYRGRVHSLVRNYTCQITAFKGWLDFAWDLTDELMSIGKSLKPSHYSTSAQVMSYDAHWSNSIHLVVANDIGDELKTWLLSREWRGKYWHAYWILYPYG